MQRTVVVLGSGPIRIGQGIEFDYSCVHCVWALRESGYRAVIVNNNPETVSTDFDTGDALYFEPVTLPDVLRVVRHEGADGVVVQFGGQTAINLAQGLHEAGVPVLGTQPSAIAAAEDREQFDRLLERLGVARPPGRAVTSLEQAHAVADDVGYPVLVRPSFVLGGRAMEIVHDRTHLDEFFAEAQDANPGQPVLVDKYFLGQEAELDVVSDGHDTLVPGIMEHVERAGVHSGDSMAVYPPVSLSPFVQAEMARIACGIARELGVRGLMNIQFVVQGGVPYVLEVNPRASRTVPYLSKVSGIPMIQLATRTMMGERLADLGYTSGVWCAAGGRPRGGDSWKPRTEGRVVPADEYAAGRDRQSPLFAVKAPVFSFQKLGSVDPALGPEMKSTGEVLGIDQTYAGALYKALLASGVSVPTHGRVVLTVADEDKPMAVEIARALVAQGYRLAATGGTHAALQAAGIASERLAKIQEGAPSLLDALFVGDVSLMINTPSPGRRSGDEARRIRRACIETGVACVTSIDTASALAQALPYFADPLRADCLSLTEYLAHSETPVRA